jgi:hypothetical protein
MKIIAGLVIGMNIAGLSEGMVVTLPASNRPPPKEKASRNKRGSMGNENQKGLRNTYATYRCQSNKRVSDST